MIRAVLFDLDDTLFEQRHWLDGAWAAVAGAAGPWVSDTQAFHRALVEVAGEGSDRGGIIDRALLRTGDDGVPVRPLVDAFLRHRPTVLPLRPGTRRRLARLRSHVPIGLVTDGYPPLQRAKLDALGLGRAFDVVVLSDDLGRQFRKPHPAPFAAALDRLGVAAEDAVYVGDRPDKDVAGAQAVGMRAVRVYTGEYAGVADRVRPWAIAVDVVEAMAILEGMLDGTLSDLTYSS